MPLQISHSIKLSERHFNLIPFVLWGYFYWFKIAAVRKISVSHGVMLTLRAKVRWEGQAEKWRQEGKRARSGAKCQRKLSFFKCAEFFSLCPGSHVMLCLRRGVEKHLLLPSASILIISVNRVALSRLSSSREIESSSRSAQLQFMEPGPRESKRSALSPFIVCKGSLSLRHPAPSKSRFSTKQNQKILVLVRDLPLFLPEIESLITNERLEIYDLGGFVEFYQS